MHDAVRARFGPELMSSTGEILSKELLAQAVDPSDVDTLLVLNRQNARRPVNQLYKGPSNLQVEAVDGFVAQLERGRLGLVQI
jgi:hypothetical protein